MNMVKYKTKQSDFDELNEKRALQVIRYYTLKEGVCDVSKINPETLQFRHAISKKDFEKAAAKLLADGKVESGQ